MRACVFSSQQFHYSKCVRAYVRSCVFAGVCACVHSWLNELVTASEFVLCVCVFVYLGVVSAQQIKVLRRKHTGTGHVDHVTPLSFTSYICGSMSSTSHSERPDWAVSPEDSDEDEVTSSSRTLAAEGAQRDVSSGLLGLRQFTPQEVAVEGASANRLLHRVHVNLQQFDNL